MKKYPKNPQVFFSTDGLGEVTYDATLGALETGYKFFNISEHESEFAEVARAITDFFKSDKEIDREEYFFQVRIGLEDIESNQTRNAIARISKELDVLRNVDCLVIDRPSVNFEWTLRAWYELKVHQEWGVITHIGVANFDKDQIKLLMEESGVTPACNLIEFNIRNQRWDRVSWCQENAIGVQAYGTLVGSSSSKKVFEMAQQKNVPVENLVLAWMLNCGISVSVAADTPTYVENNFRYRDLELTQEEIIFFWRLNKFKNNYPETFINLKK
jgi:2,5-diketo-D-gluconate reductase A